MAFMMPVMMLVMNLTVVAVIWFGGIRIDNGGMQIGDLMAFIQYVMQIMFALVMASMMFVMVPRADVSAKRINKVLEMKPSFEDKGTKKAESETRDTGIRSCHLSLSWCRRACIDRISVLPQILVKPRPSLVEQVQGNQRSST